MGGGDKPLLDLAGTRIIERIVASLDVPHIAISANGDPECFAALKLPVLSDGDFAGEGPLAGVLAGLEWAASQGAETLLTVPGDTPFIPKGFAAALAPAPACAASNGREQDRRDVAYFGRRISMRRFDFPAAKWDPFFNVNTPEDLAAARAIAEGKT